MLQLFVVQRRTRCSHSTRSGSGQANTNTQRNTQTQRSKQRRRPSLGRVHPQRFGAVTACSSPTEPTERSGIDSSSPVARAVEAPGRVNLLTVEGSCRSLPDYNQTLHPELEVPAENRGLWQSIQDLFTFEAPGFVGQISERTAPLAQGGVDSASSGRRLLRCVRSHCALLHSGHRPRHDEVL